VPLRRPLATAPLPNGAPMTTVALGWNGLALRRGARPGLENLSLTFLPACTHVKMSLM